MKKSDLKKYAHLIASVGANVQKGQEVTLYAGVEQELLANYIVEECYKLGAKLVKLEWQSDKIAKTTYKKASVKALSEFPLWRKVCGYDGQGPQRVELGRHRGTVSE